MRILTPKSRKDDLAMIYFSIAITIREMSQVRLLRAIDPSVPIENKGEWYMKIVRPSGALVGFSILIRVF